MSDAAEVLAGSGVAKNNSRPIISYNLLARLRFQSYKAPNTSAPRYEYNPITQHTSIVWGKILITTYRVKSTHFFIYAFLFREQTRPSPRFFLSSIRFVPHILTFSPVLFAQCMFYVQLYPTEDTISNAVLPPVQVHENEMFPWKNMRLWHVLTELFTIPHYIWIYTYTYIYEYVNKRYLLCYTEAKTGQRKQARLNIESEMLKFNLTLTAKYTWTVAQENLNNTN